MEKASEVNLEKKSGVGVLKAVRENIQLRSGNSCDISGTNRTSFCSSIGHFQRHGELLGNSPFSISSYPVFVLWRGHSSFSYSIRTTQEVAVAGDESELKWHRA